MDDATFFILCVFWAAIWGVIGAVIGSNKGQLGPSLLFSLLLGPIGIIIALCLPNPVKEKEEHRRANHDAEMLRLQRLQLEEIRRQGQRPPPLPQRVFDRSFRIAKDGQELGEFRASAIKMMIRNGDLKPQDYYLEPDANEWIPLDRLLDLA